MAHVIYSMAHMTLSIWYMLINNSNLIDKQSFSSIENETFDIMLAFSKSLYCFNKNNNKFCSNIETVWKIPLNERRNFFCNI